MALAIPVLPIALTRRTQEGLWDHRAPFMPLAERPGESRPHARSTRFGAVRWKKSPITPINGVENTYAALTIAGTLQRMAEFAMKNARSSKVLTVF